MAEDAGADLVYRVLVRRALVAENPATLQLHFESGVLARYRDALGYRLIRTDTVGRVSKEGDWSLDFGITPDEALLHASYADLSRLPEAEREHWASFATLLPASRMFLQMRLAPAACHDDGEVRPWH
jgi:hypothetical protein